MSKASLQEALEDRILILDGAMGTMIQRFGLTENDYRGERFADHPVNLKGNNDILALTRPDVLKDVHKQYLRAGADVITTCTFGSQRVNQQDYKTADLIREMNIAAVRCAREAADEFMQESGRKAPVFVGGSVGPTGKTLSMSPDVSDAAARSMTFDEMADAYLEQIMALQEGGVDLIILETVFDALNAKAAIYAADEAARMTGVRLPLMISATIADKSGRTLCGQTLEAFYASVCHARPLLVGMNCALGAEEMRPHLSRLHELIGCGLSCYPNAGLPNAEGGYDETPQHMAAVLRGYAEQGWLNLVGGCCGTSPDYIAAIAEAMRGIKPRAIPADRPVPAAASGLEICPLSRDGAGFTVIGERCNISGSSKFAGLIRSRDFDGAIAVARRQVENGANVIDINLDDAMHNSVEVMEHFLRLLAAEPDIAALPVMIDSSHWEVLEAGLKCLAGRSLVNSISLKEGEEEFKKEALQIKRLGGIPVIMCFDERGQGDTFDRKKEIIDRACRILIDELGFCPSEIVFDLAVLAVATGIESHASYGESFIKAAAYVKENWPGVMTNGGISNVSFALRGNNAARSAMHAVFLYHACRAGLSMGIVNAGMLRNYEDIPEDLRRASEDVILNSDPGACERLLDVAEKHRGDKNAAAAGTSEDWRSGTAEERLQAALAKGITDYLEPDIKEALDSGMTPLAIVSEALMGGMRRVGELFGSGRMFLPQVVKSARVMKKAVSILEPFFASSQEEGSSRGTIILATVKGDVHDIGKNIVSVVLGCNGYAVDDLGVMVSEQTIVDEALKGNAQIIGLSALITPSLDEIVNVVKALNEAGVTIPVMVGGAAASPVHTAVKIAPHYNGTVIYVPDASVVADVASKIMDAGTGSEYLAEVRNGQQKLRSRWQEHMESLKLTDFAEACRKATAYSSEAGRHNAVPACADRVQTVEIKAGDLLEFIDWPQFFNAWGIKGIHSSDGTDGCPECGTAALRKDAQEIMDGIAAEGSLQIKAVYRFRRACSRKCSVLLYDNAGSAEPYASVPFLRQQKEGLEECLCLADFIAPEDSGVQDWLGMFAVSAGFGLEALQKRFRSAGDEYRALIAELLADRLCEAAAEYLHRSIREQCGCPDDPSLTPADLLKGRFRGIRPAPGYPACPDHSLKRIIWDELSPEERIGLRLTDNFTMIPASSISGFIFLSPEARYFSLGRIGRDQAADYASRRNISLSEAERLLSASLGYEP